MRELEEFLEVLVSFRCDARQVVAEEGSVPVLVSFRCDARRDLRGAVEPCFSFFSLRRVAYDVTVHAEQYVLVSFRCDPDLDLAFVGMSLF